MTIRNARTRRRLAVPVAALTLVLAGASTAHASVSVVPDQTARPNGAVYAVAQVGDRTIIGGTFTAVSGVPRQGVAAILPDGTLDLTFNPRANGKVNAIAGSEDGSRIFLGGIFTEAGGAARANLAAVDASTGTAVEDWQADTTGTYPDVNSLAVSGDRLYVAGRYGTIGTTTRKRFVAVGVGSGDVIANFRPRPDRGVNEVVVSPDGTKVYVGGAFTSMGGEPRLHGAAELLAATGDATGFNPSQGGGNVVTIALSPDGSRFFYSTDNNTLFAYDTPVSNDPTVSDDPAWLIKTSGNTQAMAVSDTELYFGGHFSQILTGRIKRAFLASLNPADGEVTSWDPLTTGGKMGVWALLIEGNHLHAGGVFAKFGDVSQPRYARFTGSP